ncbi:N-acetylglucosamine-6-phosphate deacetylase [Halanaerobium kushneri]|uniref:N-acetylglucosamine-6-phosphate deacetylase n=1 Tax=Halanaerobium kushneri TaxID=56779 RepID=A0A1N7AW17_9FIRM|nr:N-acetylglucosamine-6-phosphate deacetylase [Halanaerobium kushneri]SIR43300.1 N-acetylglucosamine 6-phosphate deacetylase [Halanaerobium kushneri]
MKKLIKNAKIILEDRIINKGSIIFNQENAEIEKVAAYNLKEDEKMEVIDARGGYLAPGMIDIHIHGGGGFDTMDASAEALNKISKVLAEHGITSFLPTTMTMAREEIQASLENIRQAKEKGTEGARVLGTHVEGPFISSEYIGAQNSENLIEPEIKLLRDYYDVVKVVTMAPEVEGALELIEELHQHKITASAGHSAATYEEFQQAYQKGMDHFTHLYNAMTGLHHRRPGLVGAAFDSDATVELIVDLIHHHQAVDRFTIQAKGVDRVILVSDGMEATGLAEGEYELGGQKVIVKDGAARLESGVLAGSVLTLDQAVRNLLEITDLSIPEIFRMVTLNPARKLDLAHKLGRLKAGYQADIVLFDQDFKVEKTFVSGKRIGH